MLKADIVKRASEEAGVSLMKTEEAVDEILSVIKEVIAQGEPLFLRGLGTFSVKEKRERVGGRNPKTGEEVTIKARRVVKFSPGKTLKARVEKLECK